MGYGLRACGHRARSRAHSAKGKVRVGSCWLRDLVLPNPVSLLILCYLNEFEFIPPLDRFFSEFRIPNSDLPLQIIPHCQLRIQIPFSPSQLLIFFLAACLFYALRHALRARLSAPCALLYALCPASFQNLFNFSAACR
jgi:hypothetical protein